MSLRFLINTLLTALLALLISPAQAARESVVLQLKWEHEFQFAGYYAAQWQGFYDDEGLDVDIVAASREDGSLISPLQELLSQRADFAIGALDILIEKDRGHPLVILAPIFQQSPNALFSLPERGLNAVQDLIGLRIATPKADFTQAEVLALLKQYHISAAEVEFIDAPPTLDTLLSDRADVIATYAVSAQVSAAEQGIALNQLSLSDFGLNFYGDTLYTHQRVVQQRPDVVRRFVRASLKGWQYALQHREAIADKISAELPRRLFSYRDQKAYNREFARQIEQYMVHPYTEIGHNNTGRWQHVIQQLRGIGLIKQQWDSSSLFFNPALEQAPSSFYNALFIVLLCLIVLSASLALYRQQPVWLLFILLSTITVVVEQQLEKSFIREHNARIKINTVQKLNATAAKLVAAINSNLALISGLAAHVSINPAINQAQFERYAEAIFNQDPLLVNLAAAPDMTIRLIYPLEKNRAALGLNYLTHPTQRAAAEQVRDSRQMVIAGPVNLVQGGTAFIGRTAVFTPQPDGGEQFWGIVSAPIDAQLLYEKAGLLDGSSDVEIAIRGQDGRGNQGAIFFGNPEVFADHASSLTTIDIAAGQWQLGARAHPASITAAPGLWALRISVLVLLAGLLLFLLYRQQQNRARLQVQNQLAENQQLLEEVGRLASISGWKINSAGELSYWSPQAALIMGVDYSPTPPAIASILQAFEPQYAQTLQDRIEKALQQGRSFDLELKSRASDTRNARWLRVIGNTKALAHQRFELTGAVQDITEKKQFTELIEHQASHDALTGLPNRLVFNDRLSYALATSERQNKILAILFIDLDQFKPVNDNLGHKAGDELLKKVAGRIKACVRKSDTVARYSGDEFTLILDDIGSVEAASHIAEKILGKISQPFTIQTHEVYCSASIGISLYPQDGSNSQTLISNADHAMYEVKKNGRNGYRCFTREMQLSSERRHQLISQLQRALSGQRLQVYYQPIVDLDARHNYKCEALVRWFDDSGQMIPTDELIETAEETGLITAIDQYVLQQACQDAKALLSQSAQSVGLSINISPRLFASRNQALQQWLDTVIEAARHLDLTVEITERMLTLDSEHAMQVLHRLKRHGIKIAIDDFGTGYSSLSYLSRFPIDIVKIDRSFVWNIHRDPKAATLAEAVIQLALKLNMQVVAEGVETQEQLDFLQRHGCRYIQGYLFSKPQPWQHYCQEFIAATTPRAKPSIAAEL